jgi:hypothetical protein
MTLADCFATLVDRQAFKAGRVKDLRTSLRYLAEALGHASPEDCPVDATCRAEALWGAALETHWQTLTAQGQTPSAATRRNTRNNLKVTLRAAEAHGLLAEAPPPQTARPLLHVMMRPLREDFLRQQAGTSLYPASYRPTGPYVYMLPPAEWPPDIVAGWQGYQARAGIRLRATTLQAYARRLSCYAGYLLHVAQHTPTWDDCFDPDQLRAFASWHGARGGRRISTSGVQVVGMFAAMAKVVQHTNANAVATLRKSLPVPAPVHIKRQHEVTLAELNAVAEACLQEGRKPFISKGPIRHPGVHRAARFQLGVLLKFLVWMPLRQRNLRELQLDKHLYQDPEAQGGHWHLHFQGDDLKIATRGGRVNEYKVDLTEDTVGVVPILKEFLKDHRPRLPGARDSKFLFMTSKGHPFSPAALRKEITTIVHMRTGKPFYPHLIRTMHANQFLRKHGNVQAAATALGDKPETVWKYYYEPILTEDRAQMKSYLTEALKLETTPPEDGTR